MNLRGREISVSMNLKNQAPSLEELSKVFPITHDRPSVRGKKGVRIGFARAIYRYFDSVDGIRDRELAYEKLKDWFHYQNREMSRNPEEALDLVVNEDPGYSNCLLCIGALTEKKRNYNALKHINWRLREFQISRSRR
jgi:hypothetical protein